MDSDQSPSPIDFDAPSPGTTAAAAATCTSCKNRITDEYFEAAGQVICGTCRNAIESHLSPTAGRTQRLGKALGFGILGAIAGSAIYYIVGKVTGYNIGLVAIVVGFLVGKGVFKGSGQRGGRRYQILAVVLTYLAMASTYAPEAIEEMKNARTSAADSTASVAIDSTGVATHDSASSARAGGSTRTGVATVTHKTLSAGEWVVGILALLALLVGLPILAGMGSPFSLIFLVIAIVQAWKINRAVTIKITGPYQLGGPHTPTVAA